MSLKKEKQIIDIVEKINEVQGEIDTLHEIVKNEILSSDSFFIQRKELVQNVSLSANRLAEESTLLEIQLKNNDITLEQFISVYINLRKKFHKTQFANDKLLSSFSL